jgi:predicted DNA-binding transcriptional regulator AlpA
MTHDNSLTSWRRLVSRDEAASYCGLSPSSFSNWVSLGRLPRPLEGTARWDLKAIDRAIDSLSGFEQTETSALDAWREKRARRSERNS